MRPSIAGQSVRSTDRLSRPLRPARTYLWCSVDEGQGCFFCFLLRAQQKDIRRAYSAPALDSGAIGMTRVLRASAQLPADARAAKFRYKPGAHLDGAR